MKSQGVSGAMMLEAASPEDMEINPALREVLAQQFNLQLPTLDQIKRQLTVAADEDGQQAAPALPQLANILAAIEMVVHEQPRWRVLVEAHVGRFYFQKLVMYDDLRRNEHAVLGHPILRMIGGDDAHLPAPSGVVPASALDAQVSPQDILEILDADSSQQEAIVAAKVGQSFVLQGPPGTGKSQTIANIIAEMLGQGKRILFVSEKMAALDVVRDNLNKAGLGEFCLDLHNVRKDRRQFIAELQAATQGAELHVPTDDAGWRRASGQLKQDRDELNVYVREVHAPRFALGISAFQALGELARLHTTPDRDFAIPQVETKTLIDLEVMRRALIDLTATEAAFEVLDQYDTYPWGDTKAKRHSLELEADIRDHFGRLFAALKGYEQQLSALRAALGEADATLTFGWAEHAQYWVTRAVEGPRPPCRWLRTGEPSRLLALAQDAADRSRRFLEHRSYLDPRYSHGVLALDHAALLEALGNDAEIPMACLRVSSPQNYALAHRHEIATHLRDVHTLLGELTSTAAAVAELCGSSPPTTLDEIRELLTLTACLLVSPNPPQHWLDPAAFPGLRMAVKEADERYGDVAQLHTLLEPVYDAAYFELDLRGYAARFKHKYQSALRVLSLQYHQDGRRLRSLLRPGQTRTSAQLEANLYAAVKLTDSETWLREHRVEHAQLLGAAYDSERTDWGRVREMLAWAEDYHHLLTNGATPTPKIIQLATGPAKGLLTLRAQHERLADLWARWEAEANYLDSLVRVERLIAGLATLGDAEPAALRSALTRWQQGLQTFWDAAAALEAHQTVPADSAAEDDPRYWDRLREDVTRVREIASFEVWLAPREDGFAHDFGPDYQGAQTDWKTLLAALAWSNVFVREYPGEGIPEALARTASRELPAEELSAAQMILRHASSHYQDIERELGFVESVLPVEALLLEGTARAVTPVATVYTLVDERIEQLPCLKKWLDCQERLDRCEELGLAEMLEVCLDGGTFPREIVQIFEKRFYLLWLDRVYERAPALKRFSGQMHEEIIKRFRELDKGHQQLARQRLRARLGAQRAQAFSAGNAALELKREMAKKRHRAIRQIVNQVAPALLALKPCWMMSPLSVSQFVVESAPLFDVVIFDEASQVCTEDAICAILRGKQLIVVGDSKQLPPTRFFTKTLEGMEDDDDESGEEERVENGRTESILNECRAAAFDERALLWHYRSQHESLIAFSNHHFYDGRLITFPTPDATHATGVRFEFVEDSSYRSGVNRREAEHVARVIFDYVQSGEKLTDLGVVALSMAQQQAIEDAIVQQIKRTPELRAHEDELSGDDPNGFFVKNLESVQGDERKTMILSIGYGPDVTGKVAKRFGPVNNAGGERRLNVAITRARKQMIVVSSIRASHLDLHGQLTNPGARALRDYLAYAEHGPAVLQGQAIGGVTSSTQAPNSLLESPFEKAVYDALTAKGLVLVPQVGCSTYRIDFAVRDPRNHEAYLLGIDCDGATYHSSRTARDRDRLRQTLLQQMGWILHRIWSADWRANPVREVERVMAKIAQLQDSVTGASAPADHVLEVRLPRR
jgi:very-short-patch-repair endonuclease